MGIESVGFSFSAALWFHSDFLYVKFLRPICHIVIQPSCYSPSSVMILLAFLSCFLFSFFFVKDQSSFQLKEIDAFLN